MARASARAVFNRIYDDGVKTEGRRRKPVFAETGPGGVVRNSLGEIVWRPGWNQLLNVMPTTVATVADRAGDPRRVPAVYGPLRALRLVDAGRPAAPSLRQSHGNADTDPLASVCCNTA